MSRPNASRQRGRAAAQPAGWLPVARAAAFLENERQRPRFTVLRRAIEGARIDPASLDSAGLAAGAGAVDGLLAAIGELSDDGLAGNDGGDTRDYFEMAATVEAFLQAHFTAAPREQRQGVLLALAVLLCAEGDSRFGADEVLNPLTTVAQSLQDRAAGHVEPRRRQGPSDANPDDQRARP